MLIFYQISNLLNKISAKPDCPKTCSHIDCINQNGWNGLADVYPAAD